MDGARAAAVGENIKFEQNQIVVRDGKVIKSRSTMFPEQLKQLLRHQIEEVKMTCARNIKEMEGEVCLPP
jgi:phosphatidate phosphatase PAH1